MYKKFQEPELAPFTANQSIIITYMMNKLIN